MPQLFKKDSIFLGVILGILTPLVGFVAFYYINILIGKYFFRGQVVLQLSTVQVLAIMCNLFIFRYYMLKLKKDYTGRGILLSTFIYAIIFFIKYQYL